MAISKEKDKNTAFGVWLDRALLWYFAALLIAFGFFVLRFYVLGNVKYWNDIVEAIAVAILTSATVGFLYEFRFTKKYFESRFGQAISDALLWDTDFLEKREKTELEKGIKTLVRVLGGIDELQPEFGFGEVIIDHFIPKLGKPYRENFSVDISCDIDTMASGHRVTKLTTLTNYWLRNSADEEMPHTLHFSGEYKRIKDVEDADLYVLKRLQIDRVDVDEQEATLNSKRSETDHTIMEFDFEKDIKIPPGESREIHVEEQEIIMEYDMSTFFANCAINNLYITVRPPENCEPEVHFFAFGDEKGPRMVESPRSREWFYPGWLLPKQGYAIHLYNREEVKSE